MEKNYGIMDKTMLLWKKNYGTIPKTIWNFDLRNKKTDYKKIRN